MPAHTIPLATLIGACIISLIMWAGLILAVHSIIQGS